MSSDRQLWKHSCVILFNREKWREMLVQATAFELQPGKCIMINNYYSYYPAWFTNCVLAAQLANSFSTIFVNFLLFLVSSFCLSAFSHSFLMWTWAVLSLHLQIFSPSLHFWCKYTCYVERDVQCHSISAITYTYISYKWSWGAEVKEAITSIYSQPAGCHGTRPHPA